MIHKRFENIYQYFSTLETLNVLVAIRKSWKKERKWKQKAESYFIVSQKKQELQTHRQLYDYKISLDENLKKLFKLELKLDG